MICRPGAAFDRVTIILRVFQTCLLDFPMIPNLIRDCALICCYATSPDQCSDPGCFVIRLESSKSSRNLVVLCSLMIKTQEKRRVVRQLQLQCRGVMIMIRLLNEGVALNRGAALRLWSRVNRVITTLSTCTGMHT